MSSSKTLTSGIAAVALVGAIGFAYAQTTAPGATQTPPAGPAVTDQQQQQQPSPSTTATPPAAPMATPSDSATPPNTSAAPASPDTTAPAERAPQADRN